MPYCGNGYPVAAGAAILPLTTLTPNGEVTGTVVFYNKLGAIGASLRRRFEHGLAPGLALAGVSLIGFRCRRRVPRRLALILFALGTLAGLAGISACGGSNSVVTSGTYTYTIEAVDINTSASVTSSFNVTVP